jgi:serine/threonine protein kinase
MEEIKGGIIIDNNKQINIVFQEISILKNKLDSIENKTATSNDEIPIEAIQLSESELNDPLVTKKTDRRRFKAPYIFKKILKDKMLEVACKPVTIPEAETYEHQRLQARLLILRKLEESPNILKFYGISTLEGEKIMIFEWAELGNLRELYTNKDISWRAKVSIALDICRGLIFVHSCHILHHDIRCENILVCRNENSFF